MAHVVKAEDEASWAGSISLWFNTCSSHLCYQVAGQRKLEFGILCLQVEAKRGGVGSLAGGRLGSVPGHIP